jgi:outer membrane lipoprotein-sorting protein
MRPSFLKVELRGDENLSVLSDGETLWFVDHDLDEVEELPQDKANAVAALLPGFAVFDIATLRNEFEPSLDEGGTSAHVLRLEPRDSESSFQYSVVIELDSQLRMKRSRLEYNNGDVVRSEFRNWQRHERLSPHAFTYRPEGD